MIAETVSKPMRPGLNPYTKALRRERIFSRRRLGWPYSEIAREEGLSQERVRQIVIEALERQGIDRPADHALLQMVRLEKAHEVAIEALAAGDLSAISPYWRSRETRSLSDNGSAETTAGVRRRGARKTARQAEPRRRPHPRQGSARGGEAGRSRNARGPARCGRSRFWLKSLKNKDNGLSFPCPGLSIPCARLSFPCGWFSFPCA